MGRVTHMDESRTNSDSTETESEEGMNESRLTYKCVMSHIWMCHSTHMNDLLTMDESCHTYEWVKSHTYEWVVSHIWMSHMTHMSESYHTCEWVTSHVWMSQASHKNESCYAYERIILHRQVGSVIYIIETLPTCLWNSHFRIHIYNRDYIWYIWEYIWYI